jgi:hypothetical protein
VIRVVASLDPPLALAAPIKRSKGFPFVYPVLSCDLDLDFGLHRLMMLCSVRLKETYPAYVHLES